MTDKTVDLDRHRGMAAQKATKLRRLFGELLRLRETANKADRKWIDHALWIRENVRYQTKPNGITKKGSLSREIARRYYEVVDELKAKGMTRFRKIAEIQVVGEIANRLGKEFAKTIKVQKIASNHCCVSDR